MRKSKAALHRGNDNSALCPLVEDAQIIARDMLYGVVGALAMIGIPLIMAALKQIGVW